LSVLLLTMPQPPALFADLLRAALPGVPVWEAAEQVAPEAVEAIIAWRLKPGTAGRFPNLRLICATAAGVEKIIDDPALPPAVAVMRTVDPLVNLGMAQYVLLMALRHIRALPLFEAQQRDGAWTRHRPPDPYSITAGVLGLGEAGRTVAALLHAAGFNVIGWSRTSKSVRDVETVEGAEGLASCLARSSVLVCTLPLTAETRGILDRRALRRLPQGAYVINVARGGHLVEADLLELLAAGHLAGAALDVQETEPLPPDSPLWRQPGLTITPHIAAQASAASVVTQFAANWRRLRAGQPLHNIIERSRGY